MKEDLILQIMKDMCGDFYQYEVCDNRNIKRYAMNLAEKGYKPKGAVDAEEERDRWMPIIQREIDVARKETASVIIRYLLNADCFASVAAIGVAKRFGIEVDE